MPFEIERKFLVTGDSWRDGRPGVRISQGYLSQDADRTVRVRIGGEKAWITVKGRAEGIRRLEFEYEIPLADAENLLGLCLVSVIDKTRYEINHGGHVWEIDVFHGDNEGLVVAELEVADEAVAFDLPPWVEAEISADPRYFNARLAVLPYVRW